MDDARTGIAIAATAVNVLPVIGQISSGVLAALAALLSFLPAAVGAVRCPVPFSYRILANADCQPPEPPPPPPAGGYSAPSTATKGSSVALPIAIGGGALLLALLFWPKR
jgi:hypothetical protein